MQLAKSIFEANMKYSVISSSRVPRSKLLVLFAIIMSGIIVTLFGSADGHSFLIKPIPYTKRYTIGEFPRGCKPFKCPACPDLESPLSKNENLKNRPEDTWRRGERVTIQWAKNNHWGGFVRFAIVPTDKMFEHVHQKRLAFYFGCWQQNISKCTGNLCGSDKGMNLLQRDIIIPPVIPDGVYAFSWAWYGGVHFKQDNPKFPDYYSCSFIKISGGAKLVDTYQPFFDDGDGGKKPGTCRVGFTEPGKCTQVKQCERGPVYDTVPTEFQNGNQPEVIAKEMYLPPYPTTLGRISPQPQTPTPNPTKIQIPPTVSASPIQVPTLPAGRPVCSGAYCCPGFCGKCGGSGCSKRPGGSENCCVKGIINSKRYCERDGPPCKRS